MPNRRATDSFMRLTQPLVEQRLEEMKIGRDDPKYEAPNELVTWLVRESFKRNTKSETSAEALAYRVLLLNFAAVSTSTIATSNAIFDFISAPNFEEIIPAMREEAAAALDANGGVWTNAAVKSLRRLDSALRESARISGVGGTGLARRVRLSGGVTLPDGTWIPQGATIGVAQRGLNTDPSHYGETGEAFDAFRFSRPREEAEKMDGPLPENEDLATTSPNFLAFSHGLHAWYVIQLVWS
jgi:cytochrome P450